MATIWSPFCGYNMAYCVELRDEDLSSYLNNIRSDRWFMELSVWSLACPRSVFQRYHSEKHISEFYPQDGGESQLASKLRHCHPMYNASCKWVDFFRSVQFSSVHLLWTSLKSSRRLDSTKLDCSVASSQATWIWHYKATVTIRSPCCGYNLAWCVELKGEYLWSCSLKIESAS